MLLKEKIEVSRDVLTISIRLKCLDTFTQLVFLFRLKFNEFVKSIKLSMH